MSQRILKFRAFDKKEKKMYYNLTLENGDMGYFPGCDLCDQHVGAIKPIVMQFIGLHDKKRTEEYPEGQEIYEGDILEHDSRCSFGGKEKDLHIVKFKILECITTQDCAGLTVPMLHQKSKVIGNIYENPELLK